MFVHSPDLDGNRGTRKQKFSVTNCLLMSVPKVNDFGAGKEGPVVVYGAVDPCSRRFTFEQMQSPRVKEPAPKLLPAHAPPLLPGAGPASAPGGKSSLEIIPKSPRSSPRGPSATVNHSGVPAISSPRASGPPSGRRVTGGEREPYSLACCSETQM
jgi:hypothetical protein